MELFYHVAVGKGLARNRAPRVNRWVVWHTVHSQWQVVAFSGDGAATHPKNQTP